MVARHGLGDRLGPPPLGVVIGQVVLVVTVVVLVVPQSKDGSQFAGVDEVGGVVVLACVGIRVRKRRRGTRDLTSRCDHEGTGSADHRRLPLQG